jgi:hypothetical protein
MAAAVEDKMIISCPLPRSTSGMCHLQGRKLAVPYLLHVMAKKNLILLFSTVGCRLC